MTTATRSESRPTIRRRRQQQRSSDTRERILEAAVEEFAEHGFTGASTRVVATKARVQHPALSYHFESKDGLWRAVMRSLNERFMAQYQTRAEGLRGVNSGTTLRLIMEDFIRFSAANPKFHRLMAHEAGAGGERMNWLVDEFVKEFLKVLTQLIKAAQKEGVFIAGDAYHLAYLFIGAVTRIFMLAAEVKRVSGRSPMSPAYVDEHVDLCLRLFFHDQVPDKAGRAARS